MVWLGNLNFHFRIKSIWSVWRHFVLTDRENWLASYEVKSNICLFFPAIIICSSLYIHFSAFVHHTITLKKCVPWCCIYSLLSNYIGLLCQPEEREIKDKTQNGIPSALRKQNMALSAPLGDKGGGELTSAGAGQADSWDTCTFKYVSSIIGSKTAMISKQCALLSPQYTCTCLTTCPYFWHLENAIIVPMENAWDFCSMSIKGISGLCDLLSFQHNHFEWELKTVTY